MTTVEPFSKARRTRLNASMADELVRNLRTGDDLEAESKRYGLSVAVVRRALERLIESDAGNGERAKILAAVAEEIPVGADPVDWPTPESIAPKLGADVIEIRSAMNSLAQRVIGPRAWSEWASARDRDRPKEVA